MNNEYRFLNCCRVVKNHFMTNKGIPSSQIDIPDPAYLKQSLTTIRLEGLSFKSTQKKSSRLLSQKFYQPDLQGWNYGLQLQKFY